LFGFLGLLISDYIISAGNKENNAGLNDNSFVADLKSMNYDATLASYGDEDAISDSSIQTHHDISRITNSEVVFDKDYDDDVFMIITSSYINIRG
jgi:hypothetical protein